jgi:hypothetical protein
VPGLQAKYAIMFLDYFALSILFFVAIVLFYGVIVIHDIPYEIAEKRNHPHQDAIHVAGWVSLFTLHVIWPFLWIWATLWREDRGWGFAQIKEEQHDMHQAVNLLSSQVRALEAEVQLLKKDTAVVTGSNDPAAEPEAASVVDGQEESQDEGQQNGQTKGEDS